MLWYALYHGTHYYREGVYMQSGDNEKTDTEVREILDYYKGLPERGSQEVIVSMLRDFRTYADGLDPLFWRRRHRRPG